MSRQVPLYIRNFKAEKSFNPSATPLFSLIIRRKVAEGFVFQTLQSLQPDKAFGSEIPDGCDAKYKLKKSREMKVSRPAMAKVVHEPQGG